MHSTSATKKTAEKLLALLVVLPTVLRHYIRPLRRGICFLVLALRMLEGQVHSYNECIRLGVEPRSRCLDKRLLPTIRLGGVVGVVLWTTHKYDILDVYRKMLIEALAMIEGSIPPSTLKPSLHCVGHYPDHALVYGLLRLYWMMVFERYNKFIPPGFVLQ